MSDEINVPAFRLERDHTVTLSFDGNHLHVEVADENGRSAKRAMSQEELASAPALDVAVAMLADEASGQ